MPKYKVGSCVLTYDLGDSHYGIVKTTVIKARGKGYDKQLLVENDDGSRWWVNAVSNSSDVDGVFLEIVSH